MRVPGIKRTDMAIIGMACRFPGGCNTPEAYWTLLAEGRNAVTEIPADRWEKDIFQHPSKRVSGRSNTFAAGVLEDIRGFDAAFFGISRREADAMDPQQRLLLEMAWEAIESGGQIPSRLEGRNCAVYVGISSTEYGSAQQGDPDSANAYLMLGATLSIAANRLSYQFDLRGPSMAVDTACSSAMVALDEALNALWAGRCDMALVGGISLLLTPFPFVGFSKATMLSDYGLCRAFGAEPGGYVRGEGGGVIIVKPLADAIRDGDPIHAVICGSGTNADGRTNGIALPSSTAQRSLLEETMAKFEIDPADIDFFEAHGTGTSVGDPAESRAVGEAIGQHRKPGTGPLPIGSAKSNIGHLEPASGMAGLIKTVMAIKHRAVPATLHATPLNPNIDFQGLNIAPVQTLTPLPPKQGPIMAGVNSFGFGGANATVILREHIGTEIPLQAQTPPTPPLILSARSPAALRNAAESWVSFLDGMNERDYYDAAHTAAYRRERLPFRVVVRGKDVPSIVRELSAFAASDDGAVSGEAKTNAARTGFIFSGNGAQWAGMGRQLYEESEVFRAEVDCLDTEVTRITGRSVVDTLFSEDADEQFRHTDIAQPALLAVQIGIAACLTRAGLAPDAVAGHSVGEVAAAYVAGALDLPQAARLIAARSRAQELTRGGGRMAAAGVSFERALRIEEESGGRIELAAINAANSVTFSGDELSLRALGEKLEEDRIFFRLLDLDYAFHSRAMDPVRDDFLQLLGEFDSAVPKTPFYSSARGAVADSFSLDAEYWWENIRNPVLFSDAITAMVSDGIELLVEIGPHPVLTSYLRQILRDGKSDFTPLGTMSRGEAGASLVQRTADTALCRGADVDLSACFPARGRCVELPRYSWQREPHWFKTGPEATGAMYWRSDGPFVGFRPQSAHATWENQIDIDRFSFLTDHNVGDAIVFPAAGYAECALEASAALFGDDAFDIEMLEIRRPIVLTRNQIMNFRFVYDEEDKAFRIETRRRASDDRWSLNAVGRLNVPNSGRTHAPDAPNKPENAAALTHDQHYGIASALGLDYGPSFRTVESIHAAGDVAAITLQTPEGVRQDLHQFVLHPSFMDGCLQSLFSLLYLKGERTAETYLPYQINRLRVFRARSEVSSCRTVLRRRKEKSLVADFTLFDCDGNCIAEATGVRFMLAGLQAGREAGRRFHFETIPLDYADADDATPDAVQIATALGFSDHTEREPAVEAPDLNAVAASLLCEAQQHAEDPPALPLGLRNNLPSEMPQAPDGGIAGDGRSIWNNAFVRYPAYLSELTAILCRAEAFRRDLASDADDLLSSSTVEHILVSSPSYGGARKMLCEAIKTFVQHWPERRRLRILEIGCSNALVRNIRDISSQAEIEVTVACVDGTRMSALEREVDSRDVRFVEADLASILSDTDLDRLGSFDLVLAPMVSVECGLTSALLNNIRRLLAPGGLLMASDPLPSLWADTVFGSLNHWWHPDGTTPLMTAGLLGERFAQAGYRNIHFAPCGDTTVLVADGDRRREHNAGSRKERPIPDVQDTGWIVVLDPARPDATVAEKLCQTLEQRGAIVVRLHANGSEDDTDSLTFDPDDENQWLDSYEMVHAAGIPLKGVVLVGDISADGRPGWSTLLAARAMTKINFTEMPQLNIVTCNAASFQPNKHANVVQAPLWGIGRVVTNEIPRVRVRMIDIDATGALPETVACDVAHALLRDGPEAELIVRSDGIFAPRLRPSQADKGIDDATMHKLHFTSGRLGTLAWKKAPIPQPGPDELVIAPRSTALNFRDVMFALGALPAEALEDGFAGACLGMEASGVVVATGTDVQGFKAGDEVFFFAPNCFDSHVLAKATSVIHKPARLSFDEAATIPTAFFTAQYALDHLARLRCGERLLIHGAAGGVGLAALQVARQAGADIFVTVGSPEKRALMVALGIPAEQIFDSRSQAFADDILARTNGEGVDVILNSLAGDAIHRNLSILRPFGRFLELGKRDFYENSRIGLKFFRNNLSYFGIDADQLMEEKPALAREIFADLAKRFEQGIYTPLPYRVFEASRISDAFRLMQKSGHVGKILVRPPENAFIQNDKRHSVFTPRPEASYLVTGGISGFGLATAQWLAAAGARNLILASRSGPTSEASRNAIEKLESQGVNVIAKACDVTDEAAIETLFREAETAGTPVRGVIHAAAVFDDATIDRMSEEQYRRVVDPKISGALALHRATTNRTLDFFVLYSSISTAFGNPGQASYVAANTFLETLSQHRRALGLPSQTIGWGAISDSGFLARNKELRDQLSARLGSTLMTTAEAMHELERLLASGETNLYVGEVNWQRLRAGLPILQQPAYREVAPATAQGAGASSDENILARLAEMSHEEGVIHVSQILAEEIGAVLRLTPDKVDTGKSIFDLGMDSLMALELKLGIEDRFGIEIPVMALSEGGSLNTLAEQIVAQLRGEDTASSDELLQNVDTIISRHVNDTDIENARRIDAADEKSNIATQFGT
ncbi:type I polyketide synthase [Parvibaculum sp.]|uniref:type I polyketide synthase n=4 Tax=Parvibaculum sp. TaxID=2024848 RepID=UPI001B11D506|nr:type I polyketide synthase [Parvibaculum sp.]MBO6678730.1 SDR family NAD(P)-dependent oxidoreductase [Parvibaculum sp.]MBO6685367.1 SDR family NAD(P)-dependent oxidoreductase [Parvibaculum sp.]